MKRALSMAMATAMTLSVVGAAPAHAAPEEVLDADHTLDAVEAAPLDFLSEVTVEVTEKGELEAALAEESLMLEDFYLGDDGLIHLTVSVDHELADEVVSEFVLNLEDTTAHIDVAGELKGEAADTELTIDIHEMSIDEIAFTAIDPETGDNFLYSTEHAYPAVVFAIPIGIAIGAAAMKAFTATSAVVVVGGLTYVAANEAIKRIKGDRKPKYDHFRAHLSDRKLYIGDGLSRDAAIRWGKRSKDVWSLSENQAKAVAKGVNTNGRVVGPEIHGRGQYWHFHPYDRKPKMHSFYGPAIN